MPETRVEWIIFALGLFAIAAIAVLIAASLDARLDGVPLQLQPGTYGALVTSRGLEQVSAD